MGKQILMDSKNFTPEVASKLEKFAGTILESSKTEGLVDGQKLLSTMNSQLWESESLVLTKRFALKGGKPLTVEETSIELGISKERVGEIETNAFKKLRRPHAVQFYRKQP